MDINKRLDELIELLAEYLQKTDRLLERMDRNDQKSAHYDELFEKQFARMDLAYQVIVTHSEKIENLQQQTQTLQQHTQTLQQQTQTLQQQTQTLQDETKEIFKEILSISKRVLTIEGKE